MRQISDMHEYVLLHVTARPAAMRRKLTGKDQSCQDILRHLHIRDWSVMT